MLQKSGGGYPVRVVVARIFKNKIMNKDDLSTNVQQTLFSLPEAKTLLDTGLTCNSCEHRQRWQCNSKVFQYCGVRKSKRTHNGLLKIKCKDSACPVYKRRNRTIPSVFRLGRKKRVWKR